ncbi:MAG: YicC family protein [Bacteroidetes bacterium]|nr:YicC family protein [Bacteroidota bacterium]
MIRSMTGFGKAAVSFSGKNVDVEIRSLNGKNPDISIKLPPAYKEKEMEIRNLLIDQLERGKIDLFVSIDGGCLSTISLNRVMAEKYLHELKVLYELADQKIPVDYVSIISRMPEVMRSEQQDPDSDEWEQVFGLIRKAVDDLDAFRAEEGKVLAGDLGQRANRILDILLEIENFETQRMETRKEKLRKALSDLENSQADPSRFEQELIYYLEKMDFTEEKIRLKKHGDFFLAALQEDGSQGRKMGFIVQEMGREINTLGSKAYDADIQKLVVMMKDELEKLKEQLANIL